MKAGCSPQRYASGPDLHRLRHIALAIWQKCTALGIALDDLISAGWIGYVEAAKDARTQSYPYERARFAMLDEVRRWAGCVKVGTGKRGGAWVWPKFSSLADHPSEPSEPSGYETPRLTPDQQSDLAALFARTLTKTEETVMTGLLIEGESLAIVAERLGKTEQQLAVHRSRACAKVRALLAAGLVFVLAGSARAQSITIIQQWDGPMPGSKHAPIVHIALGQLNAADGVSHWYVGGAPVQLYVMAFGKDSAALSASPRLTWTLGRSALARLSGATFVCKRAGDTTVRVQWLDAAGLTQASDSTVIRCH